MESVRIGRILSGETGAEWAERRWDDTFWSVYNDACAESGFNRLMDYTDGILFAVKDLRNLFGR